MYNGLKQFKTVSQVSSGYAYICRSTTPVIPSASNRYKISTMSSLETGGKGSGQLIIFKMTTEIVALPLDEFYTGKTEILTQEEASGNSISQRPSPLSVLPALLKGPALSFKILKKDALSK